MSQNSRLVLLVLSAFILAMPLALLIGYVIGDMILYVLDSGIYLSSDQARQVSKIESHGPFFWMAGIGRTLEVLGGVTVAIWTFLLWIVTRQQKVLLTESNITSKASLSISKEAHQVAVDGLEEARKANNAAFRAAEAAEKANKNTMRALDMAINSERGRLIFFDGSQTRDKRDVHYCFKNVGKSELRITDFNADFKVIAKADQFPAPYIQPPLIGTLDYVVEPGAFLCTWEHSGIPRTNIIGLPTMIEDQTNLTRIGTTHVVFAQFRIRYITAHGIDYIFRTAVIYHGAGISAVKNWNYEEDTPWMYRGHFASDLFAKTP